MQQLRFDQRVAVITGAGRGLGREYALLLAARGARVVVNDPGSSIKGGDGDAGPAHDVVREIKAAGGEAVANTDTVATPEGGEAIIRTAMEKYGRIDILIHNAGNVRGAPLKEMTQADFDSVLDVHLRGAFHVVRPSFPLMCKAGYGRVVLTSSIGGLYGNHRQANYSVAKAGLLGLTNVVALEGAAEGVKCNAIIPAAVTRLSEGVDTSQFPPLLPEMIAPMVAWLCHESCSITGEMPIAVGGRMARAFVAETAGVYRASWSIEDVAAQIEAIRNADAPFVAAPVPSGHTDHLRYSFAMIKRG